MRIGVLALQGGVAEHMKVLGEMNVEAVEVRRPGDLRSIDGLIIPGGESTTISLLAAQTGLDHEIVTAVADGMPTFGTCAGMIMLATEVTGGRSDRPSFGGIDVVVNRNAFGRQRESFEAPVSVMGIPGGEFPGVFIRAPLVVDVGADVDVIAQLQGQSDVQPRTVGVRQGNVLAVAFHPELTGDHRIHELFGRIVKGDAPS